MRLPLLSFATAVLLSSLAACQSPQPAEGDQGLVVQADTTEAAPAASEPPTGPLKAVHWLLGSWEMKLPVGILVETWKRIDDSTFTGMVTTTDAKGKTRQVETIELKHRLGVAYYEPTLPDQNGGKPIPFRIELLTADRFLAANPTHDYPKLIRYRLRGDTALAATLVGDEVADNQTFEMTRRPAFR